MDLKTHRQPIVEGKEIQMSQRRPSFSAMKALRLRSLSITSQISSSSETETHSPVAVRKRTLTKNRPFETLREDLIRRPSGSSTGDNTERGSVSTRPTSPSGTGSQCASIFGDALVILKSGPLQPETSILRTKKEFLVLTPLALVKFKSRSAAVERFPQISVSNSGTDTLSPVESVSSLRDLGASGELFVPLEKIVSVFNNEGTRPSFGIEVWWSDRKGATFTCLQLDFSLPDDRDDWLKQIRHAIKIRAKAFPEELIPSEIESELKRRVQPQHEQHWDAQIEIFPVIPRRPCMSPTANSGEVKKGWRDKSAFYIVLTRKFCYLAQFMKSSTAEKYNPTMIRFGLVGLSKVNVILNDERFDLVFRLPLENPTKLELSSRHHRSISSKLYKMDAYIKPAWPLWTRREVFFIDGEAPQMPLPNGEDYCGFKTTLGAFIEGYCCAPVDWMVQWKNVRHAPQFTLLAPKGQSSYNAYQLLAVFRALRFNDFFKSLSFRGIDFSSLAGIFDNTTRLESTTWLSRTGKRSLTRVEFDLVENSSVLFQEIVALLLGSESIRHIDLTNVLAREPTVSLGNGQTAPSPTGQVCEIVPPIVLLWKSLQTRCNSINISGNPLGVPDVAGLSRALQNRPDFLKKISISRCHLDENALALLWEGLHEQRSSIENLDVSHNSGLIEASKAAETLVDASRLRRLNLAYAIKGNLNGPLFRPWSATSNFEPWHLEELDLSGWKVNFDTLCGIMKFIELDESRSLRRLALTNCGISGEMATGLLCRLGAGRDMHLLLSDNPLELGSTDWIDLIHGNEAPRMLHLNMVQFQHESNFNRLLKALAHNKTIEFLSMIGTGPPDRTSPKTLELLSRFFELNDTLQYLDLSGYSGKLEDSHMGWGLSGALGGLKQNITLRQLRVRNHDIGSAEDVSELCRVLAVNKGLAMFDCQQNSFNHHQFAKLVHALNYNHHIISFPLSDTDRQYAVQKEERLFHKQQAQPNKSFQSKVLKAAEGRLDGLLKWVEEFWNDEAEKAREILGRNRSNPANHSLGFRSEYLDAWEDESLPPWLFPTSPARDKGKQTSNTT
ncbi:RNI-like protein [Annulohypoxylon maeteangense]|uniref:RNI-like protein n=1 Tax=Annulohypoxylon maeteangense TaxID=1927788 RepID=UPI002007EED5|nr:RNI-like protein [Annulohypoxylon maeteangense]KAI0887205.1 RNI-like protein [Annulohypoxylon maeteangense]